MHKRNIKQIGKTTDDESDKYSKLTTNLEASAKFLYEKILIL